MSEGYFPDFLYLSLGFWLFLFVFFIVFSVYLLRLPDDKILDYKAKTIENKKRMCIKVFKL